MFVIIFSDFFSLFCDLLLFCTVLKINILSYPWDVISVDPTGVPIVSQPHPSITQDMLQEILQMTVTGLDRMQVVENLRRALVPAGYRSHTWRANTPESYLDKLRTLVATHWFRVVIEEYRQQGTDFTKYLYVPEIDKVTGHVHHERADHGHLLKRIAGKLLMLKYIEHNIQPTILSFV